MPKQNKEPITKKIFTQPKKQIPLKNKPIVKYAIFCFWGTFCSCEMNSYRLMGVGDTMDDVNDILNELYTNGCGIRFNYKS